MAGVQGKVRKLIEPELSQEAQKRLGIHRGVSSPDSGSCTYAAMGRSQITKLACC